MSDVWRVPAGAARPGRCPWISAVRRARAGFWIAVGLAAPLCASVWPGGAAHAGVPDDLTATPAPAPGAAATGPFDAALGLFYAHQYRAAAPLFYRLVVQATALAAPTRDTGHVEAARAAPADAADGGAAAADARHVAWAQFFLGESLAALQLHHAAHVYYFEAVKQGLDPQVMVQALDRLRQSAETRWIDERLLGDDLLDVEQFYGLPQHLADWVHYEQGRRNVASHRDVWADKAFAGIDPASPYARRAQYVLAVRHVRAHRDDEATRVFAGLLQRTRGDASPGDDIEQAAALATARLAFGRGDYVAAIGAYALTRPKKFSFEEGQILGEKAWSHYYLGEFEKALGTLHALSAPSFEGYLFLDTYVLRSVIYKERCHFLRAKDVVRQFRGRFTHVIEDLRARVDVSRIERIRRAAIVHGRLAQHTSLLRAIDDERNQIARRFVDAPKSFTQHLRKIYDVALHDNDRVWQREFGRVADQVARELLDTQEQMDLLDYQVTLQILRPLQALGTPAHGAMPVARSGQTQSIDPRHHVIYAFDDEYWNDELNNYEVVLPDRCLREGL